MITLQESLHRIAEQVRRVPEEGLHRRRASLAAALDALAPTTPPAHVTSLRDIASRVRCLPTPIRRNPDAFHENRSELANEIDLLGVAIGGKPRPPRCRN